MFPFTIKYTNSYISPECKRFCNLLIPGPIIPCGRYAKQQCDERVIDKENIQLFALWCHDNKKPEIFESKVGLDLDTVYSYFYPFEDSEINAIEIVPASVPRTSIESLIREILPEYNFEKEAIDALHQVAEEHIIELFKNANACANNAGRKTVSIEDFKLVHLLSPQRGR